MPNRPAAHDHVPRRHADRSAEGTHVIRAVEDHSPRGKAIDIRCVQS